MSKANTDTKAKARKANVGERMISVKVCFWTNNIAKGKGRIYPKHAQGSGVVRIERNNAHDIRPGNPLPFHSPLDLLAVIEKVLIQHGVVLHPSRRMKKYHF